MFQAVSPRTAGFNTTDLGKLSDTGKTMTMILMLIGGSPGSTAGGMKTTTIAVLIANTIAVFKRKQNADCFGRRIEDSVIKTASSIMIMYIFSGNGISNFNQYCRKACRCRLVCLKPFQQLAQLDLHLELHSSYHLFRR